MGMIVVNGEQLHTSECAELLRMLYKDAEQIAGEFHGMNRSLKFRVNWPDVDVFVKANWKSFVAPTRAMYAERLGDPKTPAGDARKMHLALVLEKEIARGQETDNRLQIAPGTQQFEGDKFENRNIVDKFGLRPNFRAQLAAGAAKIAKVVGN